MSKGYYYFNSKAEVIHHCMDYGMTFCGETGGMLFNMTGEPCARWELAQYRQQPLGVRYSLWRDGQWQTVTREEYQQSMDSFAQLFGAES